jgi:hypothetical protein
LLDLIADPHGVAPAGKESVELYIRTYNALLRSSGETKLKVLEQSHIGMGSSLHLKAAAAEPDMGAFIYASRRLPACVILCSHVVLGQSAEVFQRTARIQVESWEAVTAPGRRRRYFFDGRQTMAAFIASSSDVDDIIPTLVAYQIEWNKLHRVLAGEKNHWPADGPPPAEMLTDLWQRLPSSEADWEHLREIWGADFASNLRHIADGEKSMRVQMLGGTHLGYARSTARWWNPILDLMVRERLAERPVYFISSNPHSIVNLLSGTARRRHQDIVRFIETTGHAELLPELQKLRSGQQPGTWDNFLYYAARVYYGNHPEAPALRAERTREEEARGLFYIPSRSGIDVAAQVITLDRLEPGALDERLGRPPERLLRRSPAILININYPLGMAAYNILQRVALSVESLRGMYLLGKAATLNGSIGDVMISNVVYDEHSQNTYWLNNCFTFNSIAPFLVYGSALDNQRAVSVKGTFLQNHSYLDFYHRESFTVVEMEAGPYLNALYETTESQRYPMGENINFTRIPFDFGLIHYASDTPYTQARTLGARGLSYYGTDSTYASAVAILRRIFAREGILEREEVDFGVLARGDPRPARTG